MVMPIPILIVLKTQLMMTRGESQDLVNNCIHSLLCIVFCQLGTYIIYNIAATVDWWWWVCVLFTVQYCFVKLMLFLTFRQIL